MNSEVMKVLTGTTSCKLKNESDLQKQNPTNYTATILGAKSVYSLFSGTVLFLGFYKGMGTVSIQVSNHEIVRYLNLSDIRLWSKSIVNKGDLIGEAFANSGLQFEYCTQWKGESKYPVRIDNNLYFKQNPIDILEGTYTPSKETDIADGIIRPNDKVEFTSDQSREWKVVPNIELEHVTNPNAFQITNPREIPSSVLSEFSDNGGP